MTSVVFKHSIRFDVALSCYKNQLITHNALWSQNEMHRKHFSFSAPSIWNSLPLPLRSCDSVFFFRKLLKTRLFHPWTSCPTGAYMDFGLASFWPSPEAEFFDHASLVDPACSITSAWGPPWHFLRAVKWKRNSLIIMLLLFSIQNRFYFDVAVSLKYNTFIVWWSIMAI